MDTCSEEWNICRLKCVQCRRYIGMKRSGRKEIAEEGQSRRESRGWFEKGLWLAHEGGQTNPSGCSVCKGARYWFSPTTSTIVVLPVHATTVESWQWWWWLSPVLRFSPVHADGRFVTRLNEPHRAIQPFLAVHPSYLRIPLDSIIDNDRRTSDCFARIRSLTLFHHQLADL